MVHESNTNVFFTTMAEMQAILVAYMADPSTLPFKFGDRVFVVDEGYWLIAGYDDMYEYKTPVVANDAPYNNG